MHLCSSSQYYMLPVNGSKPLFNCKNNNRYPAPLHRWVGSVYADLSMPFKVWFCGSGKQAAPAIENA